MQFDYSKLKGRIVEKYDTFNNFAEQMCLSKVSLSQRLNNEIEWKQSEIFKACELLELDSTKDYFFKPLEK